MRTLLVEDDEAQRDALSDWLDGLGLEITAVADAQAGLLAHLRQPYELLVIDWVMPGMDGLQLCHRVRSMPGGDAPYVLVVTGRDRPSDLAAVLDAGADDYVAKPVDAELLKTRIRIAKRRVEFRRRHREAEAALAQSEIDFQRVVERCPLGVVGHRDGTIVYVNAAGARTLHATRDELVGRAYLDFVAPEYRDQIRRRTARFERTNVPPPPLDLEVLRADQTLAIARAVPVARAMLGGERAIFTLIEDISDRQRAERELRMTQYAMDNAADAVLWIRPGGGVAYINRAGCELLDLSRAEVVGKHVRELDASLEDGDWVRMLRQIAVAHRLQYEGQLRTRSGRMVPAEVSVTNVEFDGERFFIAFVRDLTERRRLQASLQQADRLASVGSLAAGVAHEINNPLAYVIANLELLGEDLADASGAPMPHSELRRRLGEATEGAQRVARIVGDLKSFARTDDADPHPVSVNAVIDKAIDIARNEIRHRALLIRQYGDVPPTIGNEGKLTQVFLNLLVNAAHAIPEGAREGNEISVRTAPFDDGLILVEIADSGSGIPDDIRGHIFDPFFTTKPQGMGTGLGLSICHGIVTRIGGTIEVHSEYGVGTTFRLLLPVAEEKEESASRTKPELELVAEPESPRRLSILVVDDEPLVCEGIKRALAGHDVAVAKSGREAIEACRGSDFDLVLCDVMMPDVSGMEVFGRVRDAHPNLQTRFVFMTGGAFTPKAREFLESVENESIAKPFSLSELRGLVARKAETG